MTETELKTWWAEDNQLLPQTLFNLRQPDGGFFVAVEGQSTDDGRVFSNIMQDQETLQRLGGIVYQYELPAILTEAKGLMKTKKFKHLAADQETEHGVFFWSLDEEKAFVLFVSTNLSTDLTDSAYAWLGASRQTYEGRIDGAGPFELPAELASLAYTGPSLDKQSILERLEKNQIGVPSTPGSKNKF